MSYPKLQDKSPYKSSKIFITDRPPPHFKPFARMHKLTAISDHAINSSFRNRNLITDLYQYYFYNGYHSIVSEKVTRVTISFLMIFLANFLVNCIDYRALMSLEINNNNNNNNNQNNNNQTNLNNQTNQNNQNNEQKKSIFDFITISRWLSLNPYLLICFIIYCIYLVCISLNLVTSIRKFGKINTIYNKLLSINDYRLKFITWDEVVNKITKRLVVHGKDILDTTNITIYTINNKICHQSNFIISMLRAGYVTLPRYSKFLEWNYIFCVIEPITTPSISISIHNMQSSTHLHATVPIRGDANLSDTLDDIQRADNLYIYKRYNQPLLTPEEIQEIEAYENPHLATQNNQHFNNLANGNQFQNGKGNGNGNGNVTGDYLDYILLDAASSSSSSSQSNLASPTWVSNSLMANNDRPPQLQIFDSVLYNTMTHIPDAGMNDSIMIDNVHEYIARVRYRLTLVFWLNILAMPFTIIILGLYVFIKYGEKLYGNPGILFHRQLDIVTRWRLRFYNELPNLYSDRLTRIERNMDKIINTYKSPTQEILTRFVTFLIGSVFLMLLVISFIVSEDFARLEIVPNHNVIWFLGICGTLLLILNKVAGAGKIKLTKQEQLEAFDALREDLITINPQLLKTDDREYLVTLIKDIYKPRIMNLLHEVVNLFLAPYYLWKWKSEITKHANMIMGLQENHYILGNVCRHSIFTNQNELINNPHMLLSLKEFKNNHAWEIPATLGIDIQLANSVLLGGGGVC